MQVSDIRTCNISLATRNSINQHLIFTPATYPCSLFILHNKPSNTIATGNKMVYTRAISEIQEHVHIIAHGHD